MAQSLFPGLHLSLSIPVPVKLFYPWEMRRLSQGTSSPLGAIFIIVNAALGAGLLAFPFAFYSAGGVVAGIVIQAVSRPA